MESKPISEICDRYNLTPMLFQRRKGEVKCLRILRSVNSDLNPAVVNAISKWKYKPALRSGKPVSVYFTIVAHIDVT